MRWARRQSGEKGAAIVETIFVILPLLLMMFGIVELARAWFTQQLATAAVREAARAGAVVAVSADVSTIGVDKIKAVLMAGGIKDDGSIVDPLVSVQPIMAGEPPVPTGDSEVVASVTVKFKTVFPALLPMLQELNIRQTAAMRWEFSGS